MIPGDFSFNTCPGCRNPFRNCICEPEGLEDFEDEE